jgi:hypothetical protein
MRLKVLSLFLAVQFVSFALWQGVQAWEQKRNPKPVMVSSESALSVAPLSNSHEAAKPRLNQIRFSSESADGQKYLPLESDRRDGLMAVISKLPSEHISTLRNLVLDNNPNAGRGLGGKSLIILRGVNMNAEERAAVLIHEIGHNVDLGFLVEKNTVTPSEFKDGRSLVYEGDLSLDFYRISWANEKTRTKTAVNFDFVSGYAMTDPFEDFAESYVYYILHNQDFKSKTQTSDALYQKYEYMKNTVFKGREFTSGAYKPDELNRRPWDITVLSYDLEGFLNG